MDTPAGACYRPRIMGIPLAPDTTPRRLGRLHVALPADARAALMAGALGGAVWSFEIRDERGTARAT